MECLKKLLSCLVKKLFKNKLTSKSRRKINAYVRFSEVFIEIFNRSRWCVRCEGFLIMRN